MNNRSSLVYEVKCSACGSPNPVDFDAPNVETCEDNTDVFYMTCKWGKCNHKGEYRFGELKPLLTKVT